MRCGSHAVMLGGSQMDLKVDIVFRSRMLRFCGILAENLCALSSQRLQRFLHTSAGFIQTGLRCMSGCYVLEMALKLHFYVLEEPDVFTLLRCVR